MKKVPCTRLEGISVIGVAKATIAALLLLAFALPAPAAPWIQVKILNIEEGVWDSHHKKPCFKITIGVDAGEVTRATVKLTSRSNVGGKKKNPSSTKNVGSDGRVEFTVPEEWLGNPGSGNDVVFTAQATGYYTTIEYRQVQYIEYVPAGHAY